MAYPASVISFSTKVDGVDYPQAEHINTPQTEIVAMETDLLSVRIGYALQFGEIGDPADATTYYIGGNPGSAMVTTGALRRLYFPYSGTVRRARVVFRQGVSGSAETSTISFRLNNTTDTTISSAVVNNADVTTVENTALSIAVTNSDYFEIKWVTPTWVTNPTGMNIWGTVWVVPTPST